MSETPHTNTPYPPPTVVAPPPAAGINRTPILFVTAAVVVMCLVEAGITLWEGNVLHQVSDRIDHRTLTVSWLDNQDSLISALDYFLLAVIVGKFLCLGLWTYESRKRVEALGVTGFHQSRGWAFGGWICPVVNLWFPYQCVSDNAAVRLSGSSRLLSAQAAERPMLIKAWWTVWIVTLVLNRFASSQVDQADTVEGFHYVVILMYVTFAATLLSGALTVWVVGWLNRLATTAEARATAR